MLLIENETVQDIYLSRTKLNPLLKKKKKKSWNYRSPLKWAAMAWLQCEALLLRDKSNSVFHLHHPHHNILHEALLSKLNEIHLSSI